MPYQKRGGAGFEAASKIAHMEMIQHPVLQSVVQSLRVDDAPRTPAGTEPTLRVDIAQAPVIEDIVTVDAGLQVVPNPVRREKAMSFINPGASLLRLADLERLAADPIMDPRDMSDILGRHTLRPAYLPLRGVRMGSRSMKDTLREVINATLCRGITDLYDVLEFLLFEGWLPQGAPRAKRSMKCLDCRQEFDLPPKQIFGCPHCAHAHYLSDYLGLLSDSDSEESPGEEVAHGFMGVLEVLCLFRLPMLLTKANRDARLANILFIKDGSLMLRAAGFRVVDGIRRYLDWLRAKGSPMHLVGVEKTGQMTEFLEDFSQAVPQPGDVFMPPRRFIKEEIQGRSYDPEGYRDRVSYGTRIGVRLSETHVVALQTPATTLANGGPEAPVPTDFPELEEIVRTLSRLTSARYPNALLPLVHANRQVSLANGRSSRILEEYVMSLMRGGGA
ncbi:hypothetical protein [Leisingera sp. JC1]|uniref:hypothetical protein n=1 Tax=Leisingera sp. JC1 TaxID=1855282 RepID=UPI00080395CC|nr:hypothetical protein [Leisingera sp. JC1]OBY24218.1 hypothetical protein A9D60_09455 [Leisingera sp. JC1]